MNTDFPTATTAARERGTKPTGGSAISTQPALHALAAQVRPALQAVPQAPQLSLSEVVFTQLEPQQV
jgi:hypothetical protein